MRRPRLGFLAAWTLLASSLSYESVPAAPSKGMSARLSFEITGGWARAALDDLNLFPARDEGMVDFVYRRQYEYLKAQKGGFFTFSRLERSGSGFSRLHRLLPAGVRLALDLGSGWTAFLGLTYLSGRATSSYREVYDVSDLDPDKMELESVSRVEIDYPAYPISVRAWAPSLGIRLRIPLVRRVSLAASLAAGWLAASFHRDQTYSVTATDEKGRWSRAGYGYEDSGRGAGPSLEGGGRLEYAVSGRLTAFLEAVYAYRKTGRVEGAFAYWIRHQDSDSAPYETRYELADGAFWTRYQNYSRAWGVWTPREVVYDASAAPRDSRPFRLDLSGAELRVGLAVRL